MTSIHGKVIAEKAINFKLQSQHQETFELAETLKAHHVLLAFYPGGGIKPVCTRQFCDYRDNFAAFQEFDLKICGVSSDAVTKLKQFARDNNYPFTFLQDEENKVAKTYNCDSLFLLGNISRAIFIINKKGIILYRYVEPTPLTKRGSQELLTILQDLKGNNLI